MGRRVEKKVYTHNGSSWDLSTTRRFMYYNWLPLLELDVTNPGDPNEAITILRKYTWGLDLAGQSGGPASGRSIEDAGGIGGLLATYDADGTKSYIYFYDANGNVGQLIDRSDGWIDAKYEYDAYGNNLLDPADPNESGPYADDNPFRFSTKYWDDETGLGYWGYRYYSPRLGRWMSRDPAAEAGGLNLFAYVENEVTGYIDTLGTQPYTFDEQDPPCGKFKICETELDLDDHVKAPRYKDAGMDPGHVVGFELTFIPKHIKNDKSPFPNFTECCCACDGGIRVIQAVETRGAPFIPLSGYRPKIDDPDEKTRKKNRKNPKGCPPPGYVRGGGLRGKGKYSHCDAPLHGSGGRRHDFEVCAVCTHNGKDNVLGCVTFSWFDGTKEKDFKDRGLTKMSGWTKYSENRSSCYMRKATKMGPLFRKAIERWNEEAGTP